MTTLVQNAQPAAVSTAPHPQPTLASTGACDVTLRQHATPVRARRRQRLALDHAPAEAVYIVRSGLLVIEAAAPGKHRQLLALFYPGDIVRRALVPELPGVSLSAMNVAEVWRMPLRNYEAMLVAHAEHNTQAQRRLAEQNARATLHGSIIGALSGDERFASLLIELGLRLGRTGAAGVAFELAAVSHRRRRLPRPQRRHAEPHHVALQNERALAARPLGPHRAARLATPVCAKPHRRHAARAAHPRQ